MNTKQLNRIVMFRAIVALLQEIGASGIPAFQAIAGSLVAKLESLTTLSGVQNQPTEGGTVRRRTLFRDVTELAIMLASRALSFAAATGRPELAAQLRVKPYPFRKARSEVRVQIARQVHAAIVPVVAELAAYHVTPALLDELQTRIAAATEALANPRAAIVERTLATSQIAETFAEIGTILRDQVDPLFVSLQATDPVTYARYKALRKVIDRPATHGGREQDEPVTLAVTQPPLQKEALAA